MQGISAHKVVIHPIGAVEVLALGDVEHDAVDCEQDVLVSLAVEGLQCVRHVCGV
jgi:hypothetical protein